MTRSGYGGQLQPGEIHRFVQRVHFASFIATPKSGEIKIWRINDGSYWTGSGWSTTETWNVTTVDSVNKLHYYDFDAPDEMIGEAVAVTMRINGDSDTEHSQDYTIGSVRANVGSQGDVEAFGVKKVK